MEPQWLMKTGTVGIGNGNGCWGSVGKCGTISVPTDLLFQHRLK